MDYPTIDHRGPDFARIGAACLAGIKTIFKTDSHVVIYPASGTGAWEAALVNLLDEGDKVLMVETGHFASLWHKMASRLGLETEFLETDWRRGADPSAVEDRLRADTEQQIKAVCVVHNETSTGSTTRIDDIRKAIDAAGHDAYFMVDTISSLASIDYRHDEWGVDVTVSGSQKGLMLPPGLSFNALSERAIDASKTAGMRRSYWDWQEQIAANASGAFPYTPATNLLSGLKNRPVRGVLPALRAMYGQPLLPDGLPDGQQIHPMLRGLYLLAGSCLVPVPSVLPAPYSVSVLHQPRPAHHQ